MNIEALHALEKDLQQGEMCTTPPKRYVYSEPVNMILLGKGVFLSIIKDFEMRPPWIKKSPRGSSHCGAVVKDSAAVAQVIAKAWVRFLVWCTGLRIQCCFSCGVVCICGLNSIPSPGTSIAVDVAKKIKTKKIKKIHL